MANQVLEPASPAEAEMAAAATACIMAALDHSKADHIKVTFDFDDGHGAPPILTLPPKAVRFFASVLQQMAKREPMLLVPQKAELTTQEAAAYLNVSRPFVIKEIEAGRLHCRMVNRHRRIEFQELQRYKEEQKERAAEQLAAISRLTQSLGQEL
jgi:excisionase family DNA binding protein